ncbi:MAG TPA: glutamate synthase subunit beta [Actinopolymorphaceae bacterium]|jgi:glutamate synthase (NADPH/NADH) small chain
MADPRGFITTPRVGATRRDVDERRRDWKEVYPGDSIGRSLLPVISKQAGRCMDCGIPFCHQGCPLGNLIPDWNDLVWRGDWFDAIERLHATNNFPEFTGRLCPAPCETACVLAIDEKVSGGSVTIKNVEVSIVDKAWDEGWVIPQPPEWLSGRTVAVVGSGPAGLAAAQQLTRVGHTVVVYERADRIGGLLRYGIPEFKMEKRFLDRRIEQMSAEGTIFRAGVDIGTDISGEQLRERFDAVLLAVGATSWRDLPAPGRDARGVYQAMEYLPQSNRVVNGEEVPGQITASGKNVVIIGGGDTGADCLGTAHRQGAKTVTQLEIMPQPGTDRIPSQPWPTYPMTFRVAPAHEEGGDRKYAMSTKEFLADDNGNLRALRLVEVEFVGGKFTEVEGTEIELEAELVLLAMGFVGPERGPLTEQLGLEFEPRGAIARDAEFLTNVPGVYVAGDAGRGQSLIVWAIAEGRAAAAAVDTCLREGVRSTLPVPIAPTTRPLTV